MKKLNLKTEMHEKAEQLKFLFKEETNYDLLVYCGFRSLREQAELFCIGRTQEMVSNRYRNLEEIGWTQALETLKNANENRKPNTSFSRIVTHALPGQSYHNYGLAFDAVPMRNGKCVWEEQSYLWQVMGKIAEDVLNLEWAGTWTKFREYPHVQMEKEDVVKLCGLNQEKTVIEQLYRKEYK